MQQFNIFDFMYDKYKITKPVRLIEFFAGIGSQAKALKNLGVPFEHHRICEWAIPSILAYASIHRDELEWYGKDFCSDLSKEQIVDILFDLGVSANYNEPAKKEQLKRMPEDRLRLVFNSIHWENNLVDISRTKADMLSIVKPEEFTYLLTYSFPCQDLSLAGLQKGMSRDGNTRSGLLWQVERILKECHESGNMPEILLMENVPMVCSSTNIEDFKSWMASLENMGYSNYWQILNAKDYSIPQNRQRCFMVSIHGDYSYKFPQPVELKLRLKDMLEKNVDEKYYLSEKMLEYVSATGGGTTKTEMQESTNKSQDPLQQNKINEQGLQITLEMAYPDEFDLADRGGRCLLKMPQRKVFLKLKLAMVLMFHQEWKHTEVQFKRVWLKH